MRPDPHFNLLSIDRKRVEFLVWLSDSQELIAGTDIHDSVYNGRASANCSSYIEFPENLSIFSIQRADEVLVCSREHESIVSGPGHGNRTKVRSAIRRRRLPEDLTGSSIERRDRALLRKC